MAKELRKIIITGVTKGLGRAMCEGLIAQGHVVWGCGRSTDAIKALQDTHGAPHDFAAVDVADDAAVATWANQLLEAHGPPDLLLNNAALMNHNAPLWEVPPEEFSLLIDINIKGVYHVIRHFAPAMIAAGEGVIVNFSSTWGRTTSPEVAPYCASKWAIEGLSQAMAHELPRGMACVALNPGVIHTEMLERCFGPGASGYPKPKAWAQRALPFLLSLGPQHNGRALAVS